MIYASAENLCWMNREAVPERFREPAGWDRYRACLEEGSANRKRFFPNIGIAPVSNGALLAAGLYMAHRRGLPVRKTSAAFIETLAVSNWCKFSVQDRWNRDHVGDLTKLTKSLPFVIAELSLLRPKVVLLPKTIWRHTILAEAMRGATWTTEFLPVPQFNATVVNTHLSTFAAASTTLRNKFVDAPLGVWISQLTGIKVANAWRYIGMLDTL
jgi:hypothetical protein